MALGMALPATAATPTFTGDVPTDFTGPGILTIPDPFGDVGVPGGIPGTTGWEFADLRLTYDSGTDTMYVGMNAATILGDADGDGAPGGTSAWLAGLGGTDSADLSGSETAAVYFDLDQDGTFDVIGGVGNGVDITGFSVNVFSGALDPPNNFGAALPGNTGVNSGSPSAGSPDFEFTITNWSTLPGQDALLAGFRVGAFLGSQLDDGVGEDFILYEQSPSTIVDISSSAASVGYGGSVTLTVSEENDGDVPLTGVHVEVWDDGTMIADLNETSATWSSDLNGDAILDPGETWSWTLDSGALIAATTFTADGYGTVPGDIGIGPLGDADEEDEVTVEVTFNPTTITTIGSSAPIVDYGDSVTLTITEENDGDVALTSPQVVVTKNGSPLITLTASPDSGDPDGNDVLDPGETWSWTTSSGPITVDPTVFVATGSGTDPAGNVITYPGDAEEQDDVTVEVAGEEGCTPGFWKNNADKHDASAWCDAYDPGDDFDATFGIPTQELKDKGKDVFPDPTLLEALGANGGGINALARHAVAALLNACSDCVEYPMDAGAVIAAVQAAIGDEAAIEALHIQLAMYNEAGCPVNQHGECIEPEVDG